MNERNQSAADELIGAIAMAFGPDRGFMIRDIIDASERSPVLRSMLIRRGLMNHVRLGHVVAQLEGCSFAGMRLWREWSSRKGHRYSLRQG